MQHSQALHACHRDSPAREYHYVALRYQEEGREVSALLFERRDTMTITYPTRGASHAYAPSHVAPSPTAKPVRKTWFRRVLAALKESRMRQAEREIARHSHLLPTELELAGDKLSPRTEDGLPFIR
jgi:hypothetical protein